MRKTTLATCAIIIAIALIASQVGGQSSSQPQKFEYGILEKNNAKFRTGEKLFTSKEGFKGLFASLGGVKPPNDPSRAEDAVLQLLGQGGWELVAADGADRVYFKRPIN